MQRMVDQVAKYFVPAIVITAIGVGIGWYFVGNIGFTYSLLAFVSVMIIACPCALRNRNTCCTNDGFWKSC